MFKYCIPLVLLLLIISCDTTQQNTRKIIGEWVIDSLHSPVQLIHLQPIKSRILFDSKQRFGHFAPEATVKTLELTYSLSGDLLTVWVADQGLQFEIEKLTDRSLVLSEFLPEVGENRKIFLTKAE
jgi:hypothetical protein